MGIGLLHLFVAYAIIWVVIFLYLLNLSRKIRALRREIDLLKK